MVEYINTSGRLGSQLFYYYCVLLIYGDLDTIQYTIL